MKEYMNMETIDNSNGVIFPFYDADTNMVYLCGKVSSRNEKTKSLRKLAHAIYRDF